MYNTGIVVTLQIFNIFVHGTQFLQTNTCAYNYFWIAKYHVSEEELVTAK